MYKSEHTFLRHSKTNIVSLRFTRPYLHQRFSLRFDVSPSISGPGRPATGLCVSIIHRVVAAASDVNQGVWNADSAPGNTVLITAKSIIYVIHKELQI